MNKNTMDINRVTMESINKNFITKYQTHVFTDRIEYLVFASGSFIAPYSEEYGLGDPQSDAAEIIDFDFLSVQISLNGNNGWIIYAQKEHETYTDNTEITYFLNFDDHRSCVIAIMQNMVNETHSSSNTIDLFDHESSLIINNNNN